MEALSKDAVVYPTSDGKPLSDNTLQFQWIVLLKENLDALLPDFVAGDLLWYPVEGDNQTRAAPDTMVALGRPKGHRGSYKQWEEGGIAPQVVFEVLTPGNTQKEMEDKLAFYDRFGVHEYYVIDPDLAEPEQAILEVWLRKRGKLRLADFARSHTSPLLGITFTRQDGRLTVYAPDGRRFQTMAELAAERDAVAAERDAAATRLQSAEAEIARLAARLRALGLEPE